MLCCAVLCMLACWLLFNWMKLLRVSD